MKNVALIWDNWVAEIRHQWPAVHAAVAVPRAAPGAAVHAHLATAIAAQDDADVWTPLVQYFFTDRQRRAIIPRRCTDGAASWVKVNGRYNYRGLDTSAEGKFYYVEILNTGSDFYLR